MIQTRLVIPMNYGKYIFAARVARSLDMRRPYDRWVAKAIGVAFGMWCLGFVLCCIGAAAYVTLSFFVPLP